MDDETAGVRCGAQLCLAWPVMAHGQQPALPVVGFLSSLSSQDATLVLPAFHDGLKQTGYVEGRDIKIE
jgi:putative tryptophan/tyrosine transport system substrate-binding protein